VLLFPSSGTTIVDAVVVRLGSSTPMGWLLRTLRLIRPVLPETDVCREWYGDLEVDEDRFSAMLAELEPPGHRRRRAADQRMDTCSGLVRRSPLVALNIDVLTGRVPAMDRFELNRQRPPAVNLRYSALTPLTGM